MAKTVTDLLKQGAAICNRRPKSEGRCPSATTLRIRKRAISNRPSLFFRQEIHGFVHTLAGHDANFAAVVKVRHDLQSNVQPGVGNNPDYFGHAFSIKQVHRILYMWRAQEVHRLQLKQIHQEAEATIDLIERESNVCESALGFIRPDMIAVPDNKQVARLI